jgi:hypothetical protein
MSETPSTNPEIPPESVKQIEQNAAVIQELAAKVAPVVPQIPPQLLMAFPPRGSIAPKIARKIEDLDTLKTPEDIRKGIYLDAEGKLIPEWQQLARMYHRPIKKVAIVGFADSKSEAPYDDPTWEIWGLNDLHGGIPRFDRWFDIHTRDNIDEDYKLMRNRGQPTNENIGLAGLRKLNVPVYMQDRFEDIPNSLKFPLKEITEAFPFGKYMTNSISYMIALAIYEGYQEISVYGVDMAVGSEYVDQRPSCEYWIGVAAGRGIKVYIPNSSDLCHCHYMYAFDTVKQSQFNEKLNNMVGNMKQRHAQICDQERQAHDARMQYEGAMGAIAETRKIAANLDDKL